MLSFYFPQILNSKMKGFNQRSSTKSSSCTCKIFKKNSCLYIILIWIYVVSVYIPFSLAAYPWMNIWIEVSVESFLWHFQSGLICREWLTFLIWISWFFYSSFDWYFNLHVSAVSYQLISSINYLTGKYIFDYPLKICINYLWINRIDCDRMLQFRI
jgi:hypothetical protein